MRYRAFISCRFPVDAKVRAIAEMLRDEITPVFSEAPKIGNLAFNLKQQIQDADCVIVIATDDCSPFVQNEIGMAYALGKPTAAIKARAVKLDGIQQYLSTWLTFSTLADCARQISGLKQTLLNELSSRFLIPGGPDTLLSDLTRLGILGCYPDRASAFRQFLRFWDDETEIAIVGSTLEGFRKCLGVDPRKLLARKLRSNPRTTVRVLLTHPDFVTYRETQEAAPPGIIASELRQTDAELARIQRDCGAGNRLAWRFFRGAPTCFMIMAGDCMLLNPYLYMQAAIFNFSLVVRNTGSEYDIYNRYKEFHLDNAWAHERLAVTLSSPPKSQKPRMPIQRLRDGSPAA